MNKTPLSLDCSLFANSLDTQFAAPKNIKRHPLALAVAAVLLATTAQAQTSETEDQNVHSNIEVIAVNGETPDHNPMSKKFARPLLDTAQTINVIPNELIEQRAATSLRDVLRNVSGISMQAGEGGTPAGDQLSIRGYSARTDIFVDNVRDFGGYTRDPFNLEQVEVVKGPSSDYSGRGSTGGSINLVSKSPSLTDRISSTVALGTDNFTRVTIDTNQTLSNANSTAVRLNVLYHDQDTPGRNEVSNKRYGVAPSIALGIETDTQVTLSAFYLKQENVPDYGIPWVPDSNIPLSAFANKAPPVDFSNWYGLTSRDFEDTETTMLTAQVEHKLSGNVGVQNITRYGITERDSMITAPRFLETTSTLIRRSDEKYRDQEDTIISNQTNVIFDINSGENWEHKILAGVEFSGENETRFTQALTGTDSPPTDLFNPTPSDPYLENYIRTGGKSTADSKSAAVYLSDSIKINEKWQINGGLRWDKFDLEYTPDGASQLDRTDSMTSYRAGIVYKPVKSGTIYFGYGTSFNPTAEALSISTSSRQPGIADLDPEENETFELGIKWEVANNSLLLTAAVFRTEKTNARTQDPDDPNDLLVLNGEQLVQGVELGLAGQITENWGVHAGYTFLDTEITKTLDANEKGNELSNSPKNSFSLWNTYALFESLQIGLGAQFVDDRYNNTANIRTAPKYWVYETSASYVLNENISFQFNVHNLTNEKYIDFVGGGHFIPGMGRLAMLSTNFSF